MTTRKPKRTVRLTDEEASKVLSAAAWINGCPLCCVFGRAGARRRGCEAVAYDTDFWSRTPDKIAACITIAPRARSRK